MRAITPSGPPRPPYAALVLAAGRATRFGAQKLLAPYGPGVFLDGALRAAFAAPASDILVVTGPEDEGVPTAARAFAGLREDGARLRCIEAIDRGLGLSASLRAGLAAAPSSAAGVFIFLGDMPDAPTAAGARLAAAAGPGFGRSNAALLAVAPVFGGRRGHPVLVARPLFSALAALDGDAGAGALLRDLGDRLGRVEIDDAGVLRDVDTLEDLEAATFPGKAASRNAP